MRQVVGYGDLAEGGDVGAAAGPSKVVTSTSGKQPHWTADGKPISASAARRYRRVIQLLAAGEIADAEQLLTKMETAVRNVEVVQALAWAKRKAGGAAQDDARNEEEDEEEEDDSSTSEVEESHDDEDGDGSAEEIQFSIPDPIIARSSHGGDSHAEIWDDSALIDAWDAALEEYNHFDALRSASRQKRGAEEVDGDGAAKRAKVGANGQASRTTLVPKKHSTLWHDPPPMKSISVNETTPDAANLELAERKVKARQLLNQLDHGIDGHVNGMPEATSKAETVTSKRTIRGVRPPSSHISGNPAWHSACAIVTQTANEIGEQQPGPSAAPTRNAQQEEVLQNLAMAWYYAGYYQAMALSQASHR